MATVSSSNNNRYQQNSIKHAGFSSHEMYNILNDDVYSKDIIDLRGRDKYASGRLRTAVNFPMEEILTIASQETDGGSDTESSGWDGEIRRRPELKQQIVDLVAQTCDRVKDSSLHERKDELYVAKEQPESNLLATLQTVRGLYKFTSVLGFSRYCILYDQDGEDLGGCDTVEDVIKKGALASLLAEWLHVQNFAREIVVLKGGFTEFNERYPWMVTSNDKKASQGALASEVIEQFLYLGSFKNASTREELSAVGITHILNMASELDNVFENEFSYLKIGIDDLSTESLVPVLEQAIQFINSARGEQGRVLVHCAMGISRSTSVVIAYLVKEHQMSVDSSIKLLKQKRSCINPNRGFLEQLSLYETQLYPDRMPSNDNVFGQ